METIDFDLPCASCGYNLRTRPRTAVCPECGTGVAESAGVFAGRHDKYLALRARGVAWMTAVRTGVLLALVAWIVLVPSSMPTFGRRSLPVGGIQAVVAALPSTASLVVFVWGMWRWFAPGRRWPLWLGRAALALAFISLYAPELDRYWVRFYFGRDAKVPWPIEPWFFDALRPLASVRWPALWAALALAAGRYAQLCWLARRRVLMAHAAFLALIVVLWPFDPWPPRRTTLAGLRWGQVVDAGSAILFFFLLVSFAALAYTLTRAIRLGGLPEANSRS